MQSNKNALERIFDNLLTNACKYNKKKGEVRIFAKDNKVFIEDTGVGIKSVNRVFERYYKENDRGLGIGMNIVKKLCESLNIEIKIKSKVGEGTKVELAFK
nr:ATP-binding protein [Halarcobacter anaerophilus]